MRLSLLGRHIVHFAPSKFQTKISIVCAAKRSSSTMTEAQIREKLNELMETVDLDIWTERKLRERVKEELELEDIAPYSQIIQEEITAFLTARVDEEEEEEPENKPPPKRKAPSAPVARLGKKAATTASGSDGSNFIVDLISSGLRKVTVTVFKGKVQVDLREFYEDRATGEVKPGPKGLALSLDQWMTLKGQLHKLREAVANGDDGIDAVQLSSDRRAYISTYKGKCIVHVREMYEKEGKTLPGKKGVTLDDDALQVLLARADDITAEAGRRGGSVAQAKAAVVKAEPVSRSKASGSTSSSSLVDVRPMESVEMGGEKVASVTKFNGNIYVDLREFFTKDGERRPGKKGIMLKPGEFRIVASNVAAIDAAASTKDLRFSLDLGSKRQVSLSEFKGQVYVAIREFYEAGGELKPGIKGLNMNLDQWTKLAEAMPRLARSLDMTSPPSRQ